LIERLLLGGDVGLRDFRFGSASAGSPKPVKGGYAAHSGRTRANSAPRNVTASVWGLNFGSANFRVTAK